MAVTLRVVAASRLYTVLRSTCPGVIFPRGHAGLAPREKLSATYVGRTKLTGQGRPGLRLAAWRVVWGVLQTNAVYAARYRHLTSRETNKLTAIQALSVIAGAVLRQLHVVSVTSNEWNPAIARYGTWRKTATNITA
jgi:transposase